MRRKLQVVYVISLQNQFMILKKVLLLDISFTAIAKRAASFEFLWEGKGICLNINWVENPSSFIACFITFSPLLQKGHSKSENSTIVNFASFFPKMGSFPFKGIL